MRELSIKTFLGEHPGMKFSRALELGGGSAEEATYVSQHLCPVTMIDKKQPASLPPTGVDFVLGDYFDPAIQTSLPSDYGLVWASYTLCFNSRQSIEEYLPFYLDKIRPGGVFVLFDFTSQETVVSKRENLWDNGWLTRLLYKHCERFDISTTPFFEEAHGHTHEIFQLAAWKTP